MPVNYGDAKIYKIEPICEHDEADVYYGSTARKRLCDRYKGHLRDYKTGNMKITSRLIFDKYLVENCHIVLVEAFPCANRDELTSRESHFIRTFPCVNKNGKLSLEDIKENAKEYYEKNAENIAVKKKAYEKTNADEIAVRHKEYYEKNADEIAIQQKAYRKTNADKIAIYQKAYREKMRKKIEH